jgi:hypothetical protein
MNLGQDSTILTWVLCDFPPVTAGKFGNSASNLARTGALLVRLNVRFTNHPSVQPYVVCATNGC